jgi:hypothetical protein
MKESAIPPRYRLFNVVLNGTRNVGVSQGS